MNISAVSLCTGFRFSFPSPVFSFLLAKIIFFIIFMVEFPNSLYSLFGRIHNKDPKGYMVHPPNCMKASHKGRGS